MSWVVDSCIILDIALKDPTFGVPSATYLDSIRGEGLTLCPVSFVELSPIFDGNLKELRNFLRISGINADEGWDDQDTEASAHAWTRYVRLKRQGKSTRRPVADLLIGGYATRFQGLITRNTADFRPYFPRMPMRHP